MEKKVRKAPQPDQHDGSPGSDGLGKAAGPEQSVGNVHLDSIGDRAQVEIHNTTNSRVTNSGNTNSGNTNSGNTNSGNTINIYPASFFQTIKDLIVVTPEKSWLENCQSIVTIFTGIIGIPAAIWYCLQIAPPSSLCPSSALVERVAALSKRLAEVRDGTKLGELPGLKEQFMADFRVVNSQFVNSTNLIARKECPEAESGLAKVDSLLGELERENMALTKFLAARGLRVAVEESGATRIAPKSFSRAVKLAAAGGEQCLQRDWTGAIHTLDQALGEYRKTSEWGSLFSIASNKRMEALIRLEKSDRSVGEERLKAMELAQGKVAELFAEEHHMPVPQEVLDRWYHNTDIKSAVSKGGGWEFLLSIQIDEPYATEINASHAP